MEAPVIRGQVNVSSSRAAGLQPKSVKENLFNVDSNYFMKIILSMIRYAPKYYL